MSLHYHYCLAKLLAVGIGALLVAEMLWTPGAASAAPLNPGAPCPYGSFDQTDMAGRYESRYMLLEMTTCGADSLTWMNDYGEHYAVYLSGDRIPGGGVITVGYIPDPQIGAYVDSVPYLLIKPAEPGWIQIYPVGQDNIIRAVYRLQKTR